MKVTRKNLIEKSLLKEKLLNLLEFWDGVWFFTRINWQRIQVMDYEFLWKDLFKAYEDYLNDTNCISTIDLQKIFKFEEVYLLKKNIF